MTYTISDRACEHLDRISAGDPSRSIIMDLLDEISGQKGEIERLRKENFALSATQCTKGWGDESGNFHCCCETAPNIERLEAHHPNPADYRYWEGRYRDEAAEVDRLKAEVERLRLALAAEREWQPIVTAPHDRDTPVLIWDGVSMWVACWVYDDQWQPEGQPSFAATHWMPLPQPPEKGT